MKRKYVFLIVSVLLVCIGILALCVNRELPLAVLLPDGEMVACVSNGYYDGMESHVEGAIPPESIADFFALTTVKKGTPSRSLPSPCFEIRATYEHDTYIIVVGADNSVSVASVGKLDSPTFWVDTTGTLFERLYNLHMENGGTEFL